MNRTAVIRKGDTGPAPHSRPGNRKPALPFLLAVALVSAGCKEEGVRVYQVPKELPPMQLGSATPPEGGLPRLPTAHPHWESLPANWQERQPSSSMRVAEIGIQSAEGTSAELAVFALPEVQGMELEFVNMWREQIHLGMATPDALAALREDITIAGETGMLFDMPGNATEADPEKLRSLIALTTRDRVTWFFKLTGPDGLVVAEKEKLKDFLAKLELHSEPHADPHAGLAMNNPGPAAGTATPPSVGGGSGLPQWTVPTGWTPTTPGAMLLASFDVAGGAKVTVSSLGGDGGGLLPNVNRWRGQIGLAPINSGQLSEVTSELNVSTGKATLVDLASEESRMLTVIVPHQGRSWFYKLLGSPDAVADARDAFLQFAQSAQY